MPLRARTAPKLRFMDTTLWGKARFVTPVPIELFAVLGQVEFMAAMGSMSTRGYEDANDFETDDA